MTLNNLHDKYCKVRVLKLFSGVERKTDKLKENNNKEIGKKRNKSELENKIIEMENTIEGMDSTLEDCEEWISDLEYSVVQSNKAKQQKEKKISQIENIQGIKEGSIRGEIEASSQSHI